MTETPDWAAPGGAPNGGAPPPPPPPGWAPQGWGPPAEFRPGIVPLRPLGLGEILDGAFALIRRYPRVTLGMSALVAAMSAGLSLAVNLGLNSFPDVNPDDANVGSAVQNNGVQLHTASVVVAIVTAVLSFILTGLLTTVIGEAVLGREITMGEAWQRIRPRFFGLVGVSLLAALLPFLGLIALIIGGIYLWGALALAVPAYVLEGIGPIAALRRSRRLVQGSWWRVFGIRLLAYVIIGMINGIIAIPFAIAAFASTGIFSGNEPTGTPVLFFVLLAIGSLIAQTVTAPLTAGVIALLYIDRRIRVEALDVTLIATVTAPTSGVGASPG